MSWLYLAAVLASALCMGLVDHRWRLVLFARPRLAAAVIGIGAVFFLVWDVVAIELGIYRRGGSTYMTGIEVAPDLPLEEIFFVLFLCYVTLVFQRGALRLLRARAEAGTRTGAEA